MRIKFKLFTRIKSIELLPKINLSWVYYEDNGIIEIVLSFLFFGVIISFNKK